MKKGQDTILITGATGKQGGAVARELLARGHRVAAMTRKPASPEAAALRAKGAEIAHADLDDAASLEKVLRGVWGVFSVENTWEAGVEKEEEQGLRLAEIARQQGVQHFVYTSVGSANRNTGIPHFDNKYRIEQAVRRQRFPSWVILRPAFFMENFVSPLFKAGIDQGQLAIALKPTTKLQMIAVNDIGKYGAMSFDEPERMNGREIDIAGDERTMPEVAAVLSRAADKEIRFQELPIQAVRSMSEDMALMLEWFDRVGYATNIQENEKEFGIHPTSLREWAQNVTWSASAPAHP